MRYCSRRWPVSRFRCGENDSILETQRRAACESVLHYNTAPMLRSLRFAVSVFFGTLVDEGEAGGDGGESR